MLEFDLSAHPEIVDPEQNGQKKGGRGSGKAPGQFLASFFPVEQEVELPASFIQVLLHDLVENAQVALLIPHQKSGPPVQNIQDRAAVPLVRVFCSEPQRACMSDPLWIDGGERSAG